MHDIRYAVRTLAKSPGLTVVSLICMALGLGASTAIFSIVNTVLLRPLPYRDAKRLVVVYTEFPKFPNGGLHRFAADAPEFHELQTRKGPWDQIESWDGGGASLTGSGMPLRVNVTYVTGGMFSMLGAVPRLGRPINPADDDPGVTPHLVISDGLWRSAFGADGGVIGKEVQLDGGKATIIGVMAKGFEFPPGSNVPADLWSPLQLTPKQLTQGHGGHFLTMVAHLRAGLSLERARQEMAGVIRSMGERSSPKFHTINPVDHPLSMYGFQDEVIRNAKRSMLMLLGAVAFFLLIACVNVSNLLLARSDARRREVAVRKALGASRRHLLQQLLTEGLLLSGAGAFAGVLLAWAAVKAIAVTDAGTIPRIREVTLDWNVVVFAVAVTLATGVVFGMAPAVQTLSQSLNETLRSAGGRAMGSIRSHRVRAALVIAELSLALVLLIGSGLLVRAFWNLQRVDPGFEANGLLTARIALSSDTYARDRDKLRQFWGTLQQKLAAIPGVQSATIAAALPPQEFEVDNDTEIENFVQRPGGPIQNVAYYQIVEHGFFETLRTKLIAGRYFDQRDGLNSPPVVIVNQTMARTFWPGDIALGKRIRPGSNHVWMTVIGVVADLKNGGLDKAAGTEIYLPAFQAGNARQAPYAVVKTSGDPKRFANAVGAAVHDIDPTVPVSQVRTMNEVLSGAESRPRFLALILTAFSSIAVVLAAFGIYGVIAYSVEQRTSEFGIRMALGAQRADVMQMVLREGFILAIAGIVLGSIVAVFLTRALEELLFDVSRFDGLTFAATILVLLASAMLACWIPARRATIVDPIRALRYE